MKVLRKQCIVDIFKRSLNKGDIVFLVPLIFFKNLLLLFLHEVMRKLLHCFNLI